MDTTITIDLQSLFWLVGGISGILVLKDMIVKRLPSTKVQEQLEEHKRLLDRDLDHLRKHDEDIRMLHAGYTELRTDARTTERLTLHSLQVIMNHLLGVDNLDEMRKASEELNEHLLDNL